MDITFCSAVEMQWAPCSAAGLPAQHASNDYVVKGVGREEEEGRESEWWREGWLQVGVRRQILIPHAAEEEAGQLTAAAAAAAAVLHHRCPLALSQVVIE
jgi:hypothetical protein